MSRLLSDEQISLLAKGFVLVLLAISLLNLVIGFQGGENITALSGALVFVYTSTVLTAGVLTDRLFGPWIQIALFCGLAAYWTYDYLSRDNTLSILLVVFALFVLAQQTRRLVG